MVEMKATHKTGGEHRVACTLTVRCLMTSSCPTDLTAYCNVDDSEDTCAPFDEPAANAAKRPE